jgi:hypothetical protein
MTPAILPSYLKAEDILFLGSVGQRIPAIRAVTGSSQAGG